MCLPIHFMQYLIYQSVFFFTAVLYIISSFFFQLLNYHCFKRSIQAVIKTYCHLSEYQWFSVAAKRVYYERWIIFVRLVFLKECFHFSWTHKKENFDHSFLCLMHCCSDKQNKSLSHKLFNQYLYSVGFKLN